MILLFPNLDTLRLALSSSIVPAEITLAPAMVTFDDQGKIYLESNASLTRPVMKNLDRIGVKGSKRHASDQPEKLSCWHQALPVARDGDTPAISNQAPVLFELTDGDDLPTLATEMLRLGNDRQSIRWLSFPGESEGESKRALLRVIGPPYYTLLRALDRSAAGTKGVVRAYLERAPRVWVEIGHTHPLAAQVRVAEGQHLLIRAPREWIYLDDEPFQDIYEIIHFALPARPVQWSEAQAPQKIEVALRLTAGNAADVPELWVMRDRPIEQLDALVRDSDERLTQRLMFAVAHDPNGKPTVVLRTRPSKLAPPHLALENAHAYKPFWKLPNLFVPVGKRLHPTLRRDAVRRLLAADPDQVVWLFTEGGSGFTPESVPDGAFRPLEDWVDYVIEAEQRPLAAWIEATRFEFDHFICKDPGGPKTKPDKGDKQSEDEDDGRAARAATPQPKAANKSKGVARPGAAAEFLAPPEEVKKPSEWKIRRAELEKRFQEIDGGLDAPERQALWPQLAIASAGIPEEAEAAICWLNAMWNVQPVPAAWLEKWVRGELPQTSATIRAEEFDKLLEATSVGQKEARTLVTAFLWLAAQNPVPPWLKSRLAAVQTFLEKHEAALPVRAVWLAGYRLAQLSGSDVLGLARVRDRTLNRLLTEGLSPEKDLPSFLRYAGHKDSERMRVVREKALDLHAAVRKWSQPHPQNLPYIDLLFAFALAKLQETTTAKKLVEDARKVMEVPIPSARNQQDETRVTAAVVSNFLFKAFKSRVDQVLAGKPHTGPLSPELISELDEIHARSAAQANNPQKMLAFYSISRMKEQSHVLEPHEKLDPYSEWTKTHDSLKKELAELHSLRDPARLAEKARRLLKEPTQGKSIEEVQFLTLHDAIPLGPRVGEAFTVDLLRLVPKALTSWPPPNAPETHDTVKKQCELLQRALAQAGNYDRRDIVKMLVDEFSALIHSKKDEERFKLISSVGGHSLRVLKKLGMRDEIDRFYARLQGEILRGASTGELKKKYANKPDVWSGALQTSLNLAGGWLSFGLNERAEPILTEARNELLGSQASRLSTKDYPMVARAYVTALGQGQSETGMARITELFRKMDEKAISNTFTTMPFYSRFHLNLVEDVIRAIVSDDFALGPGGRKWLDDDEYLVRRRIHADMKRERERSGL
jgi:FtsH ternary system-associated peptide